MNAITSFDKKNAQAIHEEMLVLLAPLSQKYGVSIRQAGGSIGTNTLTLKVEFRAEGEDAEKAAFVSLCDLFRCKPEDYGRMGVINGQKVKLIGFEPKRSKFCVRGFGMDTKKVMLYTEDALRVNWKIESAMKFHAMSNRSPEELQRDQDAEMKAKGFTHRVNGWVHPEAGGSDYPVEQYFKASPTEKEIAAMFSRSCVKTDFKITTL